GVSLFEEFKLLSSLVHASDRSGWDGSPAEKFTLIGGDFPGIQHVIYTISSKGAAKSLRGRSLFLQLLGDGVVRRILAHESLNLPWMNVVYMAGGNFVILAPADVEGVVPEIEVDVNSKLLHTFHGDISLSLACQPIEAGVIGQSEAFWQTYSTLKQR